MSQIVRQKYLVDSGSRLASVISISMENILTTFCTLCKGAERLGLKGEVERKDLVARVNNPWPGANGEEVFYRQFFRSAGTEKILGRFPFYTLGLQ